jgi:hypothetical protein
MTRPRQLPVLVMFIHPHCPCSRATLGELEILLSHCKGKLEARLWFFLPETEPAAWAQSDLWATATRLPNTSLNLDPGGTEQRRFGARVSGEAFLFLPDGTLAFHGGITGGRGHAGDNAGRAAVEWILLHGGQTTATAPVYGCEL